jgi:hypothetical protein
MNLIILLCMPLVPALVVTIYLMVAIKKEAKQNEQETA